MYIAQRIQRKTPTERVPLSFDFGANALPSGETIVGVAAYAVTPTGELTVDTVGFSDTAVDLWVTGGTAGTDYIVDLEVTTTPTAARIGGSGLVQVRTR